MYCPNCGQKLASSDWRHTNLDEISYGGVNRDRSLAICRCDACGKVSGVIPDIEEE